MAAPAEDSSDTLAGISNGEAKETKNGHLSSDESDAENREESIDGDIVAEKPSDVDADGKAQVAGVKGGAMASVGRQDTKSNGSRRPARSIFPDMLTSARRIFSNTVTPARAAFALFTVVALWLVADRPERAVWTFSVIAVSFLALWTILLTAAIPVRTVLVSVSYIALLAGTVAHASTGAGIFVILLDAGYAAGLFGYALADYRQRRGMERSAENVPSRSPEEQKEDSRMYGIAFFYAAFGSLVFAGGAALAIFFMEDLCRLIVVLSLLIDLSLFCWICLVTGHMLRDALIGFDKMFFVYWAGVFLLLPDLLLSCLFGKAIGVLVHPLGVMGTTGLLGYSLGVYDCYKKKNAAK